jgi:Lipase (class 3)
VPIDTVSDSLGGALATLAAADMQSRRGGEKASLCVCVMNYGSPRVGNRAFATIFNKLVPNAFRIVNGADLIARMPQSPARFRGGYRHVGRLCLVHENGTIWTEGEGDTAFEILIPGNLEEVEELIKLEHKMWSLLVSGQSLGHHLEDSYYVALKNAVLHGFEKICGNEDG